MNSLASSLKHIVRSMRRYPLLANWNRWVSTNVGRGQGLVEYALILALVAIVTIGILTQLGGKASQVFSTVSCTLDGGAVASSSSSHPGNPQGGGGGIQNNTQTSSNGGC